MKTLLCLLLAGAAFVSCSKVNTDKPSASVETQNNSQSIKEKMIHSRAVQAAIWGMPAVNYKLMYNEFAKLGGKYNEILYWPGLLTWKNQTLTPNPDVIYIMPFF